MRNSSTLLSYVEYLPKIVIRTCDSNLLTTDNNGTHKLYANCCEHDTFASQEKTRYILSHARTSRVVEWKLTKKVFEPKGSES